MMLRWWRKRRRGQILAEPIPEDWLSRIVTDVALWHSVPEGQRRRLEDDLRLFIAERFWEPCGGIPLTAPMCAVIAAQACILTLGHSVDTFDHVRSILIYPDKYWAQNTREDEAGIITEEFDELEGEASSCGTVVLSWREVVADAKTQNGHNLVLHEFAHQLGFIDVIEQPTLGAIETRWREVFLTAFDGFRKQVDRGKRVKGLDEYGAEDEEEFFAVATESFFERGAYLKTNHPQLYQVLSEYYNQDPAAWPCTDLATAVQ
jgi:Mlc titration factor MtfA (ptsG expression regulator)